MHKQSFPCGIREEQVVTPPQHHAHPCTTEVCCTQMPKLFHGRQHCIIPGSTAMPPHNHPNTCTKHSWLLQNKPPTTDLHMHWSACMPAQMSAHTSRACCQCRNSHHVAVEAQMMLSYSATCFCICSSAAFGCVFTNINPPRPTTTTRQTKTGPVAFNTPTRQSANKIHNHTCTPTDREMKHQSWVTKRAHHLPRSSSSTAAAVNNISACKGTASTALEGSQPQRKPGLYMVRKRKRK